MRLLAATGILAVLLAAAAHAQVQTKTISATPPGSASKLLEIRERAVLLTGRAAGTSAPFKPTRWRRLALLRAGLGRTAIPSDF